MKKKNRFFNTDGFAYLKTLIEVLGILIVVLSAFAAFLNILRNSDKTLVEAEKYIEYVNEKTVETLNE